MDLTIMVQRNNRKPFYANIQTLKLIDFETEFVLTCFLSSVSV